MKFIKWLKRRQWQARSFFIAGDFDDGQTKQVNGYVYKGIAIHQVAANADLYTVTHLGTGHRMMGIYGDRDTAQMIAKQLADAADWRFNMRPAAGSPESERLRYVRNEIFNRWQPYTFIRPSVTPFCPMAAAAASALNK